VRSTRWPARSGSGGCQLKPPVILTAQHGGIDIAYQSFGTTGDPLLLILGIGADMLYWHDQFCAALVHSGFQVARFDNRDSGEWTHLDQAVTPNARRVRRHPDTAPYRLEDMADDATAVSTPWAGHQPTWWGT
jgi:pimeloyl-ACP methyl ester carboxylesterase